MLESLEPIQATYVLFGLVQLALMSALVITQIGRK